jgi:hypothetical protein
MAMGVLRHLVQQAASARYLVPQNLGCRRPSTVGRGSELDRQVGPCSSLPLAKKNWPKTEFILAMLRFLAGDGCGAANLRDRLRSQSGAAAAAMVCIIITGSGFCVEICRRRGLPSPILDSIWPSARCEGRHQMLPGRTDVGSATSDWPSLAVLDTLSGSKDSLLPVLLPSDQAQPARIMATGQDDKLLATGRADARAIRCSPPAAGRKTTGHERRNDRQDSVV